jgi:hypothetical protein
LFALLVLYWSRQVSIRAFPALNVEYFGDMAVGNTALPVATGGLSAVFFAAGGVVVVTGGGVVVAAGGGAVVVAAGGGVGAGVVFWAAAGGVSAAHSALRN